jgi:hypothetical protein
MRRDFYKEQRKQPIEQRRILQRRRRGKTDRKREEEGRQQVQRDDETTRWIFFPSSTSRVVNETSVKTLADTRVELEFSKAFATETEFRLRSVPLDSSELVNTTVCGSLSTVITTIKRLAGTPDILTHSYLFEKKGESAPREEQEEEKEKEKEEEERKFTQVKTDESESQTRKNR